MLERIERYGFILVCVIAAILGTLRIQEHLHPSTMRGAIPSPLVPGIAVAEYIPADFDRATTNVVLVVNSGCHFCQESMPFYRRLATLRRRGQVRLVATSLEAPEALRAYLEKNGLDVDSAVQYKISLPVSGTPTLVLTDRNGRIERSWLGRLTPDQEQEVIASLGT